jgi:hypothetical protein
MTFRRTRRKTVWGIVVWTTGLGGFGVGRALLARCWLFDRCSVFGLCPDVND